MQDFINSQAELEDFFRGSVWADITTELLGWERDILQLLANPSSIEDYKMEWDAVITAKLRGNLETLRNILRLPDYMAGINSKEGEEDV